MTERDGKELTATALRALGGEIRREGRSTYWQLPSGSTQRLDLDMTTGTEWPGWLLDQYRAAGYHFAVYASEEGWQVLDTTSGSGAYVAPEPSESLNIALLLAIVAEALPPLRLDGPGGRAAVRRNGRVDESSVRATARAHRTNRRTEGPCEGCGR